MAESPRGGGRGHDPKPAPLTIGEVAARSGVAAKTIRYYESIGLVPAPPRGDNGYRRYPPRIVDELRFVARARGLGFPIRDVEALLDLWRDDHRASAEVKAVARAQLTAIAQKIAELEAMRAELEELVARCRGDAQPACPILDRLTRPDQETP